MYYVNSMLLIWNKLISFSIKSFKSSSYTSEHRKSLVLCASPARECLSFLLTSTKWLIVHFSSCFLSRLLINISTRTTMKTPPRYSCEFTIDSNVQLILNLSTGSFSTGLIHNILCDIIIRAICLELTWLMFHIILSRSKLDSSLPMNNQVEQLISYGSWPIHLPCCLMLSAN